MKKAIYCIIFSLALSLSSVFAISFDDFNTNIQIAESKSVNEKVDNLIKTNTDSKYVGYEDYYKFTIDTQAINRAKAIKKTTDDITIGNSSCKASSKDIIKVITHIRDGYIRSQRNNLFGLLDLSDPELDSKKVNESCRTIINCIENERSPLDLGLCRGKITEMLIANYTNIEKYEGDHADMQIKTAFFDGNKENGAIEISESLKTMISFLTDQQEQVTMIYKPNKGGQNLALNEGRQVAINDPYLQASTVTPTTESNSVQNQVSQFINQSQSNQAAQICLPQDNNQPTLQQVIDQLKTQQGSISADWKNISTQDQINNFIQQVQKIGSDKLISMRSAKGMLASLSYDPDTQTYAIPDTTSLQEFNGSTNTTTNPNQPSTNTVANTVTFDNLDGPLKNGKQIDQCLNSCTQKTQCSSKSGISKTNCDYLNLLCKSACLCNFQGYSIDDDPDYTDSGWYKLTSMNAGIQGRICLIPSSNETDQTDLCKVNGKLNEGGRTYNRGCMTKNLNNRITTQKEKSSGNQAATAEGRGTFASRLVASVFKNAHMSVSLTASTKPSTATEPIGYAKATSESRKEEITQGGVTIQDSQIYSNYESMIDSAGLTNVMSRFSESLTKLDHAINGRNESFIQQCQ